MLMVTPESWHSKHSRSCSTLIKTELYKGLKRRQTLSTNFHYSKKRAFFSVFGQWNMIYSMKGSPLFMRSFWHQDWGGHNRKYYRWIFFNAVNPKYTPVGGEPLTCMKAPTSTAGLLVEELMLADPGMVE